MALWTIRDHVNATAVRVVGGVDHVAPRRERLLRMVFDGRPLGDYALLPEAHKEERKRLEEMQGLAIALISADVDREIESAISLPPRGHVPTPDFEVVLRSGARIRTELCRLSDSVEKRYIDALSEIGRRAENLLSGMADVDSVLGTDNVLVRLYGGVPTPKDIAPAALELADVVANDVGLVRVSTRLWPVGPERPTLFRLGAHWARVEDNYPARIMMDPSLELVHPDLEAAFDPMFAAKAKKIAKYAAGKPVWLVMYGDTGMTFPLGAVDSIARRETFDPHPFERVIVGCFTAGVVFERGAAPRYASLTTTG
jgi:hypothetical protein